MGQEAKTYKIKKHWSAHDRKIQTGELLLNKQGHTVKYSRKDTNQKY
jgi:hypothetical protein